MNRADYNLAFLLQYENVAWFDGDAVRILDRRVYPIQVEYVICKTHNEVAKAIADMVTQSAGPFMAAAMGMVLAAHEARSLREGALLAYLEAAAYTLSHARPTTAEKMVSIVDDLMAHARRLAAEGICGEALVQGLHGQALAQSNCTYESTARVAGLLAGMIPDGGTVMTQCFAEITIGTLVRALREQGKRVRFICPETRPYLQGARLTASVISDMDYEVHLITDNMPGYILKDKKVDVFTSASDVICVDGHIVNKVGTFQIALAAHYWGIPYFVTGDPNSSHPTIDTVRIEERDPSQVLEILGTRVAKEKVKAYYPAFDITPPHLCSGVVTTRGIFSPYDLARFFED